MSSLWVALVSVVVVSALAAMVYGRWRRRGLPPASKSNGKKLDIVMVHPDLGLGGAERLVVDAGVGLSKLRGHRVRIYTNFHDPKRCFSETIDGSLSVTVVGSWLPRHVKGRGHVLFASLRMAYAAVYLSLVAAPAHCYIVDQVAAAMPVLWILCGAPILFYCHFPDQLCDPNRVAAGGRKGGIISLLLSVPRLVYRYFFDCFEGWTMRAATRVVCNSKFSRSVTVETFAFLKAQVDEERDVLYPPINIPLLTQPVEKSPETDELGKLVAGRKVVLSINRFERKKELTLAVAAFAAFLKAGRNDGSTVLVLAGGYDPRLAENVEYHLELVALAKEQGIPDSQVVFLRSFSDNTKRWLLHNAALVVYTPSREHFGIVPVEAMAWGKPVVAVASGGPLESITTSREVGLLCPAEPKAFAAAFEELLGSPALRETMGAAAKRRCAALFGLPSFAENLESRVKDCL